MKSRPNILAALVLLSIISLSFTGSMPSIAAQSATNEALDEPSVKTREDNGADLTNNVNKSEQVFEGFSKKDIDKPEPTLDKNLENSIETIRNSSDEWNFNDTSKWGDFAYVDGNMTRLVVGVNGEKPTSYIELEKITAKHRGKIVDTVSIGGEIRAAVVELLLTSVAAFVEETHTVGLASYIEPSMKVQIQLVPNDPYWSWQWGPQKIEADWAWNTTIGDPSVLVAVVDTGVYYTHPDLDANYVPLGYDWVNNDTDPIDDNGHGTHVSGTIAAVINNGVGIAGLAQVRIMAEKVLDSGGWGTSEWVASGIIHAVDQGADIISMSLGGYGYSELMYEAVTYAYDSGVLVIAAAGNDNTDMKLYPAGYDEVVAVAATDRWDNKAWFSNWGDWIELAAPGVDIYSTVPWGYEFGSGTSMATPHVTGVAALIWSGFPNKTRDWVRLWLRYTADDLGDPGFDVYYGFGRINARKAVEQSPPSHELIAYEWRTPPYVEPASSATINATVLNFGENNETGTVVQLLANGTMADQVSIAFLASGETAIIGLTWNPVVEGLYNVTLYVVPVAGELSIDNNVLWKYIYVGVPAKAVVLHSAGNIISDIITNWQVLNTEWYRFGDTMVYIDYTTLNIEDITYEAIAATQADVLIISCAFDPWMGWQFTDSEIEAIKRYVFEGHGLIVTAGTLYDRVPNNNKLAPLFGLNETTMWSVTGTDLLHLLNVTHPLFRDVPNPFVFAEVATAIPFDWRWDSNELTGGTYMALGQFQESAIVTYRGLVYIAPWLEIIPAYYQHHLQLLYNAITWSRYQKPQHELVVSLEAPQGLKPGKSALVNATVFNIGLTNETNVELRLLINGVVVNSTTIPELRMEDFYTLGYLWTPFAEGIYNVTAYALPVPGEDDVTNNVKSAKVLVSALLVALFQNWVPWDYPSNEEALDRYGVPYVAFSSSDFGSADLSEFTKVVIASDQDQSFYNGMDTYRWWFEDYVSNGGILEIHAADWGWHGGGWIGPLPGGLRWAIYYGQHVTVVDPTHTLLTEPNTITEAELDNWNYAVHGYFSIYPPDAHVIIIEDSTGMPAYLEFEYGSGYIIASSQTLEWAYKNQFSLILENSLLYMPMKYEHDLAVTLDAPTFLEPNDSVLLNATVHNRGLSNETDVELQLLINGTVVNNVTIPELMNATSYTVDYLWTPTVEATYNVTAYAPQVPGENFTINNVDSRHVIVSYAPKILAYVQYTDYDQEYANALRAIDSTFGPNYLLTELWDYTQLDSMLPGNDVLFVPEQEYTSLPTMEMIGANWSTTLSNFIAEGGIIIVSDYTGGSYGILTGAGLMSISGVNYITGSMVYLVDPSDPLAEGVSNTFTAPNGAISFITGETNVVFNDGTYPVVIHKTIGPGQVALIGFDYYASNSDADRILGNAVGLAIQYEHDLAVYLDAPNMLELGTSSMLNVTVQNVGLSNETSVELYILVNGTVVGNATIDELLVSEAYTINYLWTPIRIGYYNVTAYAPPVLGEEYVTNNVAAVRTYVFFYTRLYLPGEWVGGGVPMGWNADDASWSYTLPFDFPFYGIHYRTIYISSNGLITFTSPDSSFSNSIPELSRRLAIAPAWDDWMTNQRPGDDIYISQPDFDRIVIRWQVVAFYNRGTEANFEVILGSDGVIQVNYGYNNGTVSATIGISNGAGHILAEDVIYLNYINTIVFTPFRIEHDVAVLSVTPSATEALAGDTVDVSVVVENQGNFTESFTVTAYASSPNSTRIFFDPSTYAFNPSDVSIGYRFNATLRLEDVTDLLAYQVNLFYNNSVGINATRAWLPTWDPAWVFQGRPTVRLPSRIGAWNTTHNYVLVGDAIIIGPTFTGNGTLAVIEFEITAVPPLGESLSCELNIDNERTILLDSHGADIPSHKENGYYYLGTEPPPPPTIGYRIGVATVTDLAPGERITLTFAWNTTLVMAGDYIIWAKASVVEGETDTADNKYTDGVVKIKRPPTASFTYFPAFPRPGGAVTFNATSSTPNGGTIVSYSWNFGDGNITAVTVPIITHTYLLSGYYNVSLTVTDSEGLTDLTWKTIYIANRDIALIDVTPSTNRTYTGRIVEVNVTVFNEGDVTETFDLILYYNITAGDVLGTQTVINLTAGEQRTLTFLWNTSSAEPCHDYTVTAYAMPVLGETDVSDNTLSSSISVKVRFLGDINGDGEVDIRDISIVARAYGSYPGHPRWNPEADFNGDNSVDIRDLSIAARNFGKCIT